MVVGCPWNPGLDIDEIPGEEIIKILRDAVKSSKFLPFTFCGHNYGFSKSSMKLSFFYFECFNLSIRILRICLSALLVKSWDKNQVLKL